MLRVAVYARYSSKNQQELSVEGQIRECECYCEQKGYAIVDYYVDRAKTGRNDEREEFEKMIEDSTRYQFDAVLVYKLSRFFRNRAEAALYRKALNKYNITLLSVTEPIPEGRGGIYYEAILEAEAEAYSIGLSEDTRRGMYDAAAAGRVTGSLPFGYGKGADKKYQIIEEEAIIIREIFDLYKTGYCVTDICAVLREKGVSNRKGQLFKKSSILQILKNEKYTGVYTYNNQIRLENGCPAIIDKSVFSEVSIILKERGGKSTDSKFTEYLLAGKLICAKCNSPMYGDSSNKKGIRYYYYNCSQRRKYNACDQCRISKSELEEKVYTALLEIIEPDNAQATIDLLKNKIEVSHDKLQLDKLVEQRTAVAGRISHLLEFFEEGLYSLSLKKLLIQREQELHTLEKQIKIIETSIEFNSLETKLHMYFAELRKGKKSKDDHKRKLIDKLVKQVFFVEKKSSDELDLIVVVSPLKSINMQKKS